MNSLSPERGTTPSRALDGDFIARFARGPTESLLAKAQSLHTNIRDMLGEDDYHTILQGSYRNSTALPEINDVDILIIHKRFVAKGWTREYSWKALFSAIEKKL